MTLKEIQIDFSFIATSDKPAIKMKFIDNNGEQEIEFVFKGEKVEVGSDPKSIKTPLVFGDGNLLVDFNFKKGKIILTIKLNDIRHTMEMDKQGNFIVNYLQVSDLNLKISGFKSFKNNDDVKLNILDLNCEKIHFEQKINCQKTYLKGLLWHNNATLNSVELKVTINECIMNHSFILTEMIELDCNGYFSNHKTVFSKINFIILGNCNLANYGLILSSGKFRGNLHRIYNEGSIVTQRMYVDLRNNKKVQTVSDVKLVGFDKNVYLKNKGLIFSYEYLRIKSAKEILNELTGTIYTNDRLSIRTLKLTNLSKIKSKNEIYFVIMDSLYNEQNALLKSNKVMIKINQKMGKFINNGLIYGQNLLDFDIYSLFINGSFGRIISKGIIKFTLNNKLENRGIILANNDVSFNLLAIIENIKNGQILSNTNIYMVGNPPEISNYGELSASKNVVLKIGNLINADDGIINADELFKLMSSGKLENYGLVRGGKKLELDVSLLISNYLNAQIIAEGEAEIQTQGKLSNEGLIAVQDEFLLKAHDLIQSHQQASISFLSELNIELKSNLENQGKLEGSGPLSIKGGSLHNQNIISSDAKADIKLTQDLVNEPQASIKAQSLDVSAQGNVLNKGYMQSMRELKIKAHQTLCNAAAAIIKAGLKAQLISEAELTNAGLISTEGEIEASAKYLNNQAQGQLLGSKKILLAAKQVLSNAGSITGAEIKLQAGLWLLNLKLGEIAAENLLESEVGAYFLNEGKMSANLKINIQVLAALRKFNEGHLDEVEGLRFFLDLEHNNSFKALSGPREEIKTILNSYRQGKISIHEANKLAFAGIFKNHSLITTAANLDDINEAGDIQVVTDHLISNAGSIIASDISLKAHTLIENLLKGKMAAKKSLDLTGGGINNQGHLDSKHRLTLSAKKTQAIRNYLEGKITADDYIKLSTEAAIHNEGLVKSKKGEVSASQLENSGELLFEDFLKLTIQKALKNNKAAQIKVREGVITNEGRLIAEHHLKLIADKLNHLNGHMEVHKQFLVEASEIVLQGKLKVEEDIFITFMKRLDYAIDTLKSNGHMEIQAHTDWNVSVPINTPGSMKIKSTHSVNFETKVSATKGFELDVQKAIRLKIGASIQTQGELISLSDTLDNFGKMYGKAKAEISTKKYIQGGVANEKGKEALIATDGSLKLKAGSFINVHFSSIYCTEDGQLEALEFIDNLGAKITIHANAIIQTPKFKHQMLGKITHSKVPRRHTLFRSPIGGATTTQQEVISEVPELNIAGNLSLLVSDTEILGGILHVGGELTRKGKLIAKPFEEFTHTIQEHIYYQKHKKLLGLRSYSTEHVQYIHQHKTQKVWEAKISSGQK
ncbi:MAG: filamentous hemagglutinin outer membrane protein, partial [Francisellaceae bacterium]|nr:filamentous hemagglutinin outer membrane protein [Francisellaceae bacterium]